MRDRARTLRRSKTLSERRLWNWLRNRTFAGAKFRRQVPVGPYVLDFFCPTLKLAIEADGRQHASDWMVEYDGQRTAYLRSHGIEIVRIVNELLARDSLMVEEIIAAVIARKMAEG